MNGDRSVTATINPRPTFQFSAPGYSVERRQRERDDHRAAPRNHGRDGHGRLRDRGGHRNVARRRGGRLRRAGAGRPPDRHTDVHAGTIVQDRRHPHREGRARRGPGDDPALAPPPHRRGSAGRSAHRRADDRGRRQRGSPPVQPNGVLHQRGQRQLQRDRPARGGRGGGRPSSGRSPGAARRAGRRLRQAGRPPDGDAGLRGQPDQRADRAGAAPSGRHAGRWPADDRAHALQPAAGRIRNARLEDRRHAHDRRRRDRAPVQPAQLHRERGERLRHDPGGADRARRRGERRLLGRTARERRGGDGISPAEWLHARGRLPAGERHAQLRGRRHHQDVHGQPLQGRAGRHGAEGRRPRPLGSPAGRRGASRAARRGRSHDQERGRGRRAEVERGGVLGQRGIVQGRPHRQSVGRKRRERGGRVRDRGRLGHCAAGCRRRLRRPRTGRAAQGQARIRRERDVPDGRDPHGQRRCGRGERDHSR